MIVQRKMISFQDVIFVSGILMLGALAVILFLLVDAPARYPVKEDSLIMRVQIARGIKEAELLSTANCYVSVPGSGDILINDLDVRSGSKIKISENDIKIKDHAFKVSHLRITPLHDSGFVFNGTEYRGSLDIMRIPGGLRAVNLVELEFYLKGVVPREVHHFWPMAALKAQTVASRSYAVFESARRKNRSYDLTSDTFTQVYGGRSSERPRTTAAVRATRGKVIGYRGRVVPGYFHSSCGGHTTNVSRVWGGEDTETFKGVRSPYCRWSPHFRWRARLTGSSILEDLKRSGYGFESIEDIRGGPSDRSGRLEYVRIRSGNKWFEVPIKDFLDSIGRNTLKSSNFRIKKYPLFYDFNGYGWGHGVGLCQWCAFGISIRRWDHEKIIRHFYPGADVVDMKDISSL